MALPAPNLDDRRFQDLVDDAKRLVQQRCPEWTDHNVSDPGVTLIETFAFMVDQVLYRLNRVPDRNYVKFLELIGLQLFPPTAARADVTFWLSASQKVAVEIPAGVEVATPRTDLDDLVLFTSVEPRTIVPCDLGVVATSVADDEPVEQTDVLQDQTGFLAFQEQPEPGDALLVGLSDPVPGCAVALRFECRIEGVGVDPEDPPMVWEAWTGDGWERCDIDRDETGGLNRPGDVVLHVPRGHEASVVALRRAGWLRARIVEPVEEQPFYSASPQIDRLEAFTIGGTVEAIHAQLIREETLGLSEGVPGQQFRLEHRPVVPGDEPVRVEVSGVDGWEEWEQVESFAHSGADDRHFVLDGVGGEVQFGPAVRQPDGSILYFGAVPPKGASLRVAGYRTGGGRRGNVARGTLSVLKTVIPFVARVENRRPAGGGVDAEDLDGAKARGPVLLRTRNRAVTAEDYEQLARFAAPEVARVSAVVATESGEAGAVRVLVVPAVTDEDEGLRFEQLAPSNETLTSIARYLDERRCIGARVTVEPPSYQGVTIVARLRASPNADPVRLRADALAALNRYFHPLVGGPDGTGWPFGRPVHVGEVYAALQRLSGTEFVEDARVFPADPVTGERGDVTQRLELSPQALVYSYQHQIMVER